MADATTVELDAQYRQLREECGLLDRSGRGKILVTGPDAAEYLQGQLTNDVEALGRRRGLLRGAPRPQGPHAVRHARPQARGRRTIWIDLEPDPTPTVLSHLRTYSIGREVEIEDVGEEWAILSLIGPRAAELAGFEGLGPESTPSALRRWEGTESSASPPRSASTCSSAPATRPPPASSPSPPAPSRSAEDAAEIVRIESGTPRFGAEMSAETMPAEAGIVDAAISFTKGCYIGQEPVARLHYKGRPNRHLRGLELSAPAEPGAELRLGEKTVGAIGSSCLSPARGPIALAIVRREAEPGVELAVGEDGVTARVVDLPFG